MPLPAPFKVKRPIFAKKETEMETEKAEEKIQPEVSIPFKVKRPIIAKKEIEEKMSGEFQKEKSGDDDKENVPEAPKKEKYQRKKCEHGKVSYYCLQCGGAGICCHQKIKSGCSICKGSGYCIHGKVKQNCDMCGASSKCEHGRRRSRCTICKTGGSVCEHDRVRTRCRDCKGHDYCECGKRKEYCSLHGGSAVCEHGKRRSRCDDCGGAERCEHRRDRKWCVICAVDRVCPHHRIREQCIPCGGELTCCHLKKKTHCKICGGGGVCLHDINKGNCPICTPSIACQNCRYVTVNKNSRWKPYCFRCYCVLHPDQPIPRRFRLKEHYVVDALKSHFQDTITLQCDKRIDGGCTHYRPDILIDYGSHCIIIEIDEFRHTNYTCEKKRMVDIYADLGARNTVFLRFNPDGYKLNGIHHPTPFPILENGEMGILEDEMANRIHELIQTIQFYREYPPEEPIIYTYLFYGDQPMEEDSDKDSDNNEDLNTLPTSTI